MTSDIARNLEQVHANIQAACARVNRDPKDVTLVAVSKKKSVEAVLEAIGWGCLHFGENRIEEASDKIPLVNEQSITRPNWHMVGHIQGRKVKFVKNVFTLVHSIDTTKLARRFNRILEEDGSSQDVLLEVNISGEANKHGLAAHQWQQSPSVRAALWEAVDEICQLPQLQVRGLMMMAPFIIDEDALRALFCETRDLRDALASDLSLDLPELSMGMTNDYEIAIEEGATIIRVGRAIFGERIA